MKLIRLISLILVLNILVGSGILYSQGVAIGTRIDFTNKLGLDSGSGQFAQLFIPDYYHVPQDG